MQLSQQLRFNVPFRWFRGIGWNDPVPHDTTRVVFRRCLKASEVYGRLLGRVAEWEKPLADGEVSGAG